MSNIANPFSRVLVVNNSITGIELTSGIDFLSIQQAPSPSPGVLSFDFLPFGDIEAHKVYSVGALDGAPSMRLLEAADIPDIMIPQVEGLQAALDDRLSAIRVVGTTIPLTGGGELTNDLSLAINVGIDGQSVAAGNDNRFPSSVTGIRKGAGIGSADTAAVAKTDYWDGTVFVASGAGHAKGLVPDPGSSSGVTRFLREDASWVATGGGGGIGSIANTLLVLKGDNAGNAVAATLKTDYWNNSVFIASGASHAIGLVPDPGGSAGTTKFLREDATWQVAGTVTSAGLSTDATWLTVGSSPVTGSGTITLNRTTGLGGNLVVATPDNTTGAVSLRSLVVNDIPALPESKVTNLVGDLAARVPTSRNINTTAPLAGGGALTGDLTLTISDFGPSGGSHHRGAVPDPGSSAGATKFLREDASWAIPASTGSIASTTLVLKGDNTGNAIAATPKTDYWDGTVFVASGGSHAKGLVPDPGASSGTARFLREDSTWVAPVGSGTVTSVGISYIGNGELTVGSSPITSSGTIVLSLNSQPGNTVWAAGTSGGPQQVPSFRALVVNDFPIGTNASSIAIGNDSRFPASVTGLRKSAGAGSTDVAAVAKVDYWDSTVFGAAGPSHAKGLVPDPGSTLGSSRFLREDGTWTINTGTITLTGDITGSGTGSIATSISSGVIVSADFSVGAVDNAAIKSAVVSDSKISYASAAIPVLDIDWSTGYSFTKTISGNSTFTFSNTVAGKSIAVLVSGLFTQTWPATVKWTGGSIPTASGSINLWTFFNVGGTIVGNVIKNIS